MASNSLFRSDELAELALMPSRAIDGRAIWHRPAERGLDGIREALGELSGAGFNQVYLETFYNSRLVYPSDLPYLGHHEGGPYGEYGDDLLAAWIEEGAELGIEIHAWVENFFVSERADDGGLDSSPILCEKPEWVLKGRDGEFVTKYEGGPYLFLDPANREVRDYLLGVYDELLRRYPKLGGLNLDYIRYPVAKGRDDNGYTAAAMASFMPGAGLDYRGDEAIDRRGLVAALDADPALARRWIAFKADRVEELVAGASALIRRYGASRGRSYTLSTAVFADGPSSAEFSRFTELDWERLSVKHQFWLRWAERGYIRVATPMVYVDDPTVIEREIRSIAERIDGRALIYAGLIPTYHWRSLEDRESVAMNNARYLAAAYAAGADGCAYFAGHTILGHPRGLKALAQGPFKRRPALAPDGDLPSLIRRTDDGRLGKYVDLRRRWSREDAEAGRG